MRTTARIWWVVVVVYWVGLFVATHIPAPHLPRVPISDKIEHFVSYGVLAAGIYLAMRMTRQRDADIPVKVVLIAIVYGAIDEWTQLLPFVNRSCELADWFADVAGAAAGVAIVWLILRLK